MGQSPRALTHKGEQHNIVLLNFLWRAAQLTASMKLFCELSCNQVVFCKTHSEGSSFAKATEDKSPFVLLRRDKHSYSPTPRHRRGACG